MPGAHDVNVGNLLLTLRLAFETIGTSIGSNRHPLRSSDKYLFSTTVPHTFRMQPLRKREETQQISSQKSTDNLSVRFSYLF